MSIGYQLMEQYVKSKAPDSTRIRLWNAYCTELGHGEDQVWSHEDFDIIMQETGFASRTVLAELVYCSDEFSPFDAYWWFVPDLYQERIASSSNILDAPIDVEAMLGYMWDERESFGDPIIEKILLSTRDELTTLEDIVWELLSRTKWIG